MKIPVARIPKEGMRERETYRPEGLDMDRGDIRLVEPFEVDAFINKAGDEVVVQAKITAPVRCECSRCLKEFDTTIEAEALFSYEVRAGDVIDITEDVRQEVILAYPMRTLCKPDCEVQDAPES